MVEFSLPVTLGAFLAVVVVGVAGLVVSNVMPTGVVLMMVLPSMLAFGAVCLALGVKYGEFRSAGTA